MTFKTLAFIFALVVSVSPFSSKSARVPPELCQLFPPNQLKFAVGGNSQMPELTFKRILQVIAQVYEPIFKEAGRPPLYISPRWEDDEVNAFALDCSKPEMIGKPGYPTECGKMRTSDKVTTPFSLVAMSGGLARHPLMTPEGFIVVVCHEIGHHLGGFPRYEKNQHWAASEGQSDYFATAKCTRKIFESIGKNEAWVKKANISFDVRQSCSNSFPESAEEAAICMRSAMGGLDLARVFATFESKSAVKKIDFANADAYKVSATRVGHSNAQCRLDTYYAGSLCRIPATENFGLEDSRTGACHPSRAENNGARPPCWFHE